MAKSTTLSILMLTLASFPNTLAVPFSTNTPILDIIPAPGLPTLASLNLTPADIYAKLSTWSSPSSSLSQSSTTTTLYNNNCPLPNTAITGGPSRACKVLYYYLVEIGDQPCSTMAGKLAPGTSEKLVSSGGCGITMSNIGPDLLTSGTCADVAVAVRWAIEKCSNPDVNNANATVLGRAASNNNGWWIIDTGTSSEF